MTDRAGVLAPLERWSPTLFLVAGLVLVGFVASLVAIGLLDETAPRNVFAGAGFTIAFLGLLGLTPRLAARRPWLTRVGAAFAVLGAVGFATTFVGSTAELATGTDPLAAFAALQLLNLAGMLLGYLVVGVASLRSGAYSRTTGLLLLVPSVTFAVNFVRVVALGSWTPSWGPGLLGGVQVLAMLAIGYSLRTERPRVEHTEAPSDAAA